MQKPRNNEEEKDAFPCWAILSSIGLLICVGAFYAYGLYNPDEFKKLGTWGDFVGGTLNPILTFLTVIGLLVTIHLQQRELRLTRKELEKSSNALEAQNLTTKQQRFENTLFSMNEMLNQIVNAMDLVNGDQRKSGRDCFTIFYSTLNSRYRRENAILKEKGHIVDNVMKISMAVSAYGWMYHKHQSDLGHYFRVLYNIFRYIDQSEFSDGIYAKILRAQLSNQELLIIFYNNATERGSAFAALAERFELFDNMDTEQLLRPEHIDLASKKSFGKNPMTLPEAREDLN